MYGLDGAEQDGRIVFRNRYGREIEEINQDSVALVKDTGSEGHFVQSFGKGDVGRVRLNFIEAENDFDVRTIEAAFSNRDSLTASAGNHSILMIEAEARSIAQRWLSEACLADEFCEFALPRSFLNLGAGDLLSIAGLSFRVDSVEEAQSLIFDATRVSIDFYATERGVSGSPLRLTPQVAGPVFVQFLDLPLIKGTENPIAPHIALASEVWPGPIGVWSSASDAGFNLNTVVEVPAVIGQLQSELGLAGAGLLDRASRITVKVVAGELSSVGLSDMLNGANLVAVGDGSAGNWELLQFGNAVLIGDETYELSLLLRGLAGTDALLPASWPVGSFFVLVDSLLSQISLTSAARGLDRSYRVGLLESGYASDGVVSTRAAFDGNGLRPFSVCHLSMRRHDDGTYVGNWIRRTRIDGDSWISAEVPLGEELELYTVRVSHGASILREVIVYSTSWIYTMEMQLEDSVGSAFRVSVAQGSLAFGNGPFVSCDIGLP